MQKYCVACRTEQDESEFPYDVDWPKCWDCLYKNFYADRVRYSERTQQEYEPETKEQFISTTRKELADFEREKRLQSYRKQDLEAKRKKRLELEEAQGNKCAICGKLQDDNSRRLALDHDHTTDEIRGLLCSNCNSALGMAEDNPSVLRAAADYLEKYSHSENEQTCP